MKKRTTRPVMTCECGQHSWANLTRGFVSIFDPEFAHVFGIWNWFAKNDKAGPSVARTYHQFVDGKRRSFTVLQHHMVLPAPDGVLVDHKNNNPFDNRRCNLRFATTGENAANSKKRVGSTSRYRGVSRTGGRWQATITAKGRQRYLGCFTSEEDAARAYDEAAAAIHGEFATLNFPLINTRAA